MPDSIVPTADAANHPFGKTPLPPGAMDNAAIVRERLRILQKAAAAGLWNAANSVLLNGAVAAAGASSFAEINTPERLAVFEAHIDALAGPAKAQAALRHQIFSYEQFMNLKNAAEWIIEDVMPSHGVGVIYAPSRMGKSFLAIDILAAIAKGWSCAKDPNGTGHYFQHRIRGRRKVLYIPLEGAGGVQRRLAAYEKKYSPPTGLSIMPTTFNLCDPAEVDLLLAQIDASEWRGAVIAIDTVAQAMAGGDENSPEGMGKLILGLQRIQHHTKGFIIGIHHEGKSEAQGMRGHSSFEATADLTIWVGTQHPVDPKDLNHTQPREWRVTKMKDGETGQRHAFMFEVVQLDEVNEDGKPRTSLVVVPESQDKGAARAMAKAIHGNAAEQTIIAAFHALKGMGIDPTDSPGAMDNLPKQALAKDLARNFTRPELNAALARLMKRGRFVRQTIGKDTSRRAKKGLVYVPESGGVLI